MNTAWKFTFNISKIVSFEWFVTKVNDVLTSENLILELLIYCDLGYISSLANYKIFIFRNWVILLNWLTRTRL